MQGEIKMISFFEKDVFSWVEWFLSWLVCPPRRIIVAYDIKKEIKACQKSSPSYALEQCIQMKAEKNCFISKWVMGEYVMGEGWNILLNCLDVYKALVRRINV